MNTGTTISWRRAQPGASLEWFLSPGGKSARALEHGGLTQGLRFMAQNLSRPIQLKDVVTASGMSRRGLLKAFNRHLGRSPGTVMRTARIEYVKQLLVEQDLPLKSIAERTGFRSENTLCVAFHRATGLPPKKFQRQTWLAISRRRQLLGQHNAECKQPQSE